MKIAPVTPGRASAALEHIGSVVCEIFDNGDIQDAKEALKECLQATRTVRGRSETGQIIYRDLPDYPIRGMAAIKILEWGVGKPISRSVHAELPAPGAETGEEAFFRELLADPNALLSLQETLGKLAEQAKKVVPLEIATSEVVPEAPKQAPESQSGGSPR